MSSSYLKTLPGFHDLPPEECAVRNYLFGKFREVARRYGFVEYETPMLEATELYLKKSGGELSTQLFSFEDQGGRQVTLRPEVTASLARLLGQQQRNFPKPIRWFEIGRCFRYERPQKGRTREFYQFNVDLLGETGAAAEAELIALAIDLMLILGFEKGDFVIRVSDRGYWKCFCEKREMDEEQMTSLLQIVDKFERDKPEALESKLSPLGLTLEEVRDAIEMTDSPGDDLTAILEDLDARGMRDFVEIDFSIVRGLAYYTGVVFEVFDVKKSLRAVAGGGRYDRLIADLWDDAVDLPAAGFGMGDVVIRHLIEETPAAKELMDKALASEKSKNVRLIIADQEKRSESMKLAGILRRAGYSVTYPFSPMKVGKQFSQAAQTGASLAILVGSEFPEVSIKHLATRTEETATLGDDENAFLQSLENLLSK